MELALKKETLAYCGCEFEKSVKQNLDLGWNLPDYCSDIQRIMQCTVTPCISGVSVSGARASAVGEVQVRLVYLNDQGRLDVFYETSQLSAAAELGDLQDVQVLALAAVDYVNARAASPRRFTLSGAVSVLFRAFRRKTQTLLCDIENCGGQTKTDAITCLSLLSCAEKTFDLSETVELPEQVKPMEKLLRTQGVLRLDSQRAVTGKLLLRGELTVTMCYLSSGDPQEILHYEHRLPISQIIEVPELTEDALCETVLRLQCLRVTARTDSAGALRLVDVASSVSAFVRAYEKKTQTVVTDCYATELAVLAKTQEVPFCSHLQSLDQSVRVQSTVELSEHNVQTVEDAWAECAQCSVSGTETGCNVAGDLTVHLLCRLQDGDMIQIERSVSFSEPIPGSVPAQNVTGALMGEVQTCAAEIRGEAGAEITLDCRLQGEVYGVQNRTVCVDAFPDTAAAERKISALTLYFSQAGESLWDIAKHYRTSVAAIRQENALDGDTVPEERMILVPHR